MSEAQGPGNPKQPPEPGPSRAQPDVDTLRFLEKAVDTADVGVTLTDASGRIVFANRAEAAMHGLTPEELLGQEARRLSPSQDWRPLSLEQLDAVRKWRRERVRYRKDGTPFPVVLSSDVVRDDTGRPLGLVTACADITPLKQAEAERALERERFELLADTSPDLVLLVDAAGVVTWAGAAVEPLLGAGPFDFVGQPLERLVCAEDRSRLRECFSHAAARPRARLEVRFQAAGGEVRPFDLSIGLHRQGGVPLERIVVGRDLTAERRARALHAAHVKVSRIAAEGPGLPAVAPGVLQALCEHLPCTLAVIWQVDARARRLLCLAARSRPAADGSDPAAPLRTTTYGEGDGLPGRAWKERRLVWDDVAPEEPAGRRRLAAAVPVLGAGEVVAVAHLVLEGWNADEALGEALGDVARQVAHVVQRAQADQSRRQSEQSYRGLLELAQDVVATTTVKGVITSLNPAFTAITGWPVEQWLGRPFAPLLHPDDLAAGEEARRAVARGERPPAGLLRILTRAGETRVVEFVASAVEHDGFLSGVLVIARDVTERQEAEETRRRSETLLALAEQIADLGCCEWDVESGEGAWSEQLCRLMGVAAPPREARAELLRHVPRAERRRLHRRLRAAEQDRGPFALDCRLRTREGRIWEGQLRGQAVPGEDGRARVVATVQDVTARRRAEQALKESEERYALAIRGANDGIWDWDLRTHQVYYSPRWKAMLGHEEDEVGSSPEEWFKRVHPEDLPRLRDRMEEHLAGRTPHFEDEHRMRHRDGAYRWVHSRGFALRSGEGRPTRMAGAQTDVTDRRAYDPLTGLPNRALFREKLAEAVARSRRRPDHPFALLFLDLDHFKDVNDTLGHHAGDQLLVAVARRMEATLRPGDVVGRLGGDEFAVLLERLTEPADATRVAQRLVHALAAPVVVSGQEAFVGASIGLAVGTTGYETPEDVLRDADIAMYRAKAQGRGRCEVFDEAMRGRLLERLRLEQDVRRAVERAEFVLHYQPIVSLARSGRRAGLASGPVSGVEALVRWNHPSRGLVSPAEFVGTAERLGLIGPVGAWVLGEACRQLARWRESEPLLGRLRANVNLSGGQLAGGLLEQVIAVLTETGLQGTDLCLEMTETVLIENAEAAGAFFRAMAALGVELHIDDFGTGYCSLSYLHRFRAHALKIDRSFVARLPESPDSRAIVRTIVALGRQLGLDVVAEGVETEAQLTLLQSIGCTHAQGFFLCPPLPASEVEAFVRERGSV